MKAVIFLGPSLPVEEARGILDAVYLPPVAQTDLLTAAVNHKPDAIGIIDGVFLQSLSVWHKEILYVLEQGIPIYGASSMGALRAAETAAFGMIGIGEIYRQYAAGLMDDDEVALAHSSAEHGYLKSSEAMVNVRATFQAAQTAGIITEDQRVQLVSIAKAFYFTGRTMPEIFKAAAVAMPAKTVSELKAFVATNFVDLKRQDAIELLQTIKELLRKGKPEQRPLTFVPKHSTAFETLYNRDRRVEFEGTSMAMETIGNHVALNAPDYDELNFDALNRAVVFNLSEVMGIEPTEDEVDEECARFRKRRGLEDDAALSDWLAENHLSQQEFRELNQENAACRVMHRWLLIAMWMGRTTRWVLDELRLKGTYPAWVKRTAAQERLLEGRPEHENVGTSWTTLEELLQEHLRWTECRIDIDPRAWAEEAGFHGESNLKHELSRANAARRALLELLSGTWQGPAGQAGPASPAGPSMGGPGPDSPL
jgi:hypothetical protein